MRSMYLFTFFFPIILLQTFLYSFAAWNVKPDFILLLIVYFNLFAPGANGLWSGFLGGFLEDVLSGGPFGSASLTKTISAYSTSLLGHKMVLDNPLVQALLVLVISLLEGTLRLLLLSWLRVANLGISSFTLLIFPQAALTSLFAVPTFWVFRLGQQRRRVKK